MTERFRNKYRIKSSRLENWDYGSNAVYFVTICTKEKRLYFGDIIKNKMQYSEMGEIAHDYWLEIPHHFSFVVPDAFVVMPNHIHGIITINKI